MKTDVTDLSIQLINAQSAARRISGRQTSESAIASALKKQRSGESGKGDSLTFRMRNLRTDLAELKESQRKAGTEQARRTVMQIAESAVGRISHQLTEMQRLAESVEAGEMSGSQLADVQLMMESRAARIDLAVSQAKFRTDQIMTGENVRITTDTQTEEGFDVEYPLVDSQSLGLDAVDVVNQQNAGDATELIEDAAATISSVASDIEEALSVQSAQFEQAINEISENMAAMRSHELLGAGDETRWLRADTEGIAGNTEALRTILSATRLDAELVTSILK